MFSIFLPVRNGWPYVRECVESVLAQTYSNIELTVLDNQSTDETTPWLQGVRDKRMRLIESPASLTIEQSWSRIRACSKREYLTMIGHDDVLDREYLDIVRDLIERNPNASLFQTGARLINADGRRIRACQTVPERETAAEYLSARLQLRRDAFGTGFVMRSADYDRVGGIPPFERLFFADDALWISLMVGAYKAADMAEAFSVRVHSKSASASVPSIWRPMLASLGQFAGFLQDLRQQDEDCREVIDRLGGSFMLNRHQAVYLYALLDACQAGHVIEPATVQSIVASLAHAAPDDAPRLRQSARVRMLRVANASPLRRRVTVLWNAYYALSTRAN